MKYKSRYERLVGELPQPNETYEVSILCPFHEDHKRSASINLQNGLFHCLACQASHNYMGFKKAFVQEHGEAAEPKSGDERKIVSEATVRDMHFDLMRRQDLLDYLQNERGLTIEIIKKMKLGWHERTSRYAIPITDETGDVRNVRLYSPSESGSQKMLSWKAGYGTARLWPMEAFGHEKYVVLCEGEMDRLILTSNGLNAVTSTGGAKTWKSDWSEHFAGMKVYVIYDMDKPGEEGARKAAASIAEFTEEVRIVRLDLSKQGEDVTDFFVNYGYTVDDLKRLVKEAPPYKRPIKTEDIGEEGVEWATLGLSLLPQYRNSNIMVPVIVSARRDERLHYPTETAYDCNQDAGQLCKRCGLYGIGETTIKVKPSDARLLDFVGVTQKAQASLTRSRAGIPPACSVVQTQVIKSGTIEEILITPELDSASTLSDDSMHLIQRAFYVGVGLDYNASYIMKARPVPFHKTSKIVHHITDATPAHDSIESFEMTDEIYQRLKKFQAPPGRAKWKLAEIMTNIQDHVTRIWDRLDLHIGMDLVWHSVIEFEFDNKLVRRGWLEACVVGDTRTGKSEVATQLQRHYGYGELISGENTSYAGLVGGAIKYDDAWFVKWGRIPLNDRRMVIIDEVTGMPVEDIALMSGVRESGIADITKIESQRAHARARSIWIGNVRSPKQELGDYDYGCQALNDLIGMPEDIARFDYAMSAARDEVSPVVVNSSHEIVSELIYDNYSCSTLVLWAWSRGRDTVQFEHGAVEACWKHAIEMGESYSSNLPLVMPENQRIKLARIAAAVAARVFSTDDAGENLIVTEEHVEVARWLLDKFYSKESFGYMQMSRQKKHFAQRRVEGVGKVEEFLTTRPTLADFISRSVMINVSKIGDHTGLMDNEAKETLRFLSSHMMVEDRGSHGYRITPELKGIAERMVPSNYEYEEEEAS